MMECGREIDWGDRWKGREREERRGRGEETYKDREDNGEKGSERQGKEPGKQESVSFPP